MIAAAQRRLSTGLLARPKRACDRTAAETVGDERHGPGPDRGAEDKVTPELRALWRELFDREPPVLGRRYLEDRLAYRIQELHFGGLSDRARRKLDTLADQLEPKAARRRDPGRPIAGTQLRASGRASSTLSRSGSMISSMRGAPINPCRRSRERSPITVERLVVLRPPSTGRPDEHAAAQDTLRDLLPQELRGGIGPERSTRCTRSARAA